MGNVALRYLTYPCYFNLLEKYIHHLMEYSMYDMKT